MKFQGSVIKEQGITFGIVVVKPYVLQNQSEKSNMIAFGQRVFGMMPIILMAQDSRGIPTYFGKSDIVNFLSKISLSRIPWKEYTVNEVSA